jgi:hypothetical protein
MPTIIGLDTNTAGMRRTNDVSSSLIKRDVYDAIFNFKPYQTPVQQFFMANRTAKYATGNPLFELQEDVLVPHTFTPTDALAGGAATEADVVVGAANISLFKVGTLVHVAETGETLRVTAVDTTNDEVDYAKVGSGNITAAAASATYLIIGSAFAEGSVKSTAISTVSTFPFNYCGIHKKSVYMSGTQQSTVNYGGSDWTNQRMKATEEFKLDLERTWFMGIRHLVAGTSTVGVIRTAGGLLDTASIGISTRSQFAGAVAPTEAFFFNTFCKNLFAKGSNMKTMYMGADAIIYTNDFSKVKQQTKVSEKEYGVDVTRILTPFGAGNLVWHPLLEGYYSTWVVALDRDNFLKYVYLSGNGKSRDMQYNDNIQTTGEDSRQAEYLAEVGLHLAGGGQGVHRVLYPGA